MKELIFIKKKSYILNFQVYIKEMSMFVVNKVFRF